MEPTPVPEHDPNLTEDQAIAIATGATTDHDEFDDEDPYPPGI